MIVVLNFSHPLNDAAREYLNSPAVAGEGGALIIDVPVHVDLSAPIMPQVNKIAKDAYVRMEAAGVIPNAFYVDAFIPPGLSFVAIPLANTFSTSRMIVMRRGGGLPPQYVVGEIIPAELWH